MDENAKLLLEESIVPIVQQWVGHVFLLGAVLFLLFGIIDYFVTPEHFRAFLLYRTATATVLTALFFVNRLRRSKYYQYFILLAGTTLSAAAIELMVLAFGGYRSPYYAGINLVVISSLGFIPIDVPLSFLLLIIIYGIAVIPVASAQALADPVFLSHNGIMVCIFIITLALRWRSQKLIMNEFTLRGAREREKEQLQRLAAELRQSNEEILSFAYIVSHDLRAPLVSIKGFSGELQNSLSVIKSVVDDRTHQLGEAERKKFAEVLQQDVAQALTFIDSSAKRMDGQISAILTLSRLGRKELKLEPTDMNALVRSILNSLEHQLEQRRVKVTVGELPEIVADRVSLEQIIGNLLDNAVKYLEPGRDGEITITGERGVDECTFHIHDNGRGIATEDQHKIFELFRRAGRQDVPGEGMGLAYVKTLVRRHGGRIWCESEPGAGTTFVFTLPVDSLQPEGNS